MQIRPLDAQVSVAPQISPGEVQAIARAGFRSVINNRPDDEEPGQPAGAQIERACAAEGLAYLHLPVISGHYAEADVDATASALRSMPPPVLAFCRTGTRSTALWALQAARHGDPDEVMHTAAAAGYELSALAPRLRPAQRP